MIYYPIVQNWAKIKPHINHKEVQEILIRDFNKYTVGMWGEPFTKGRLPREFESCDWDHDRKGRRPEYFNYVKHAACHWLVNFNLVLAQKVQPKTEWRIVTSEKHSTVWDGLNFLFDFNFSAMGIPASEAWDLANDKGKTLKVGKLKTVYFASPNK